jgi:ATP-binding cassette subfamily B protein
MEQEAIIKGYDSVLIRRIAGYSLPHKGIIIAAIVSMIVSTAAELLLPVILQRIIDGYILTGGEAALEGIKKGALVFLGLLTAALIFSFFETLFMALSGQKVMKALRMDLYSHILHRSLAFIGSHPTGRLMTRITNDVETVNELFTSAVTSLLKDIFIMAGVLITLFLLNTELAIITVLSLPPVLAFSLYFRVKARDAFRKVRVWVSRVNSYLSEHISGIRIIQLFTREERVRREFGEANLNLMKSNLGEMYVFATFRPIIDFLSSTSLAVILYFGALKNLSGSVSLGVLIAFINLIRKFYQPVMNIAEKYTMLQSAMAGSERVFQVLDDHRGIPDTGTVPMPRPVSGAVEFHNVGFAYKHGEPVLRNISFKIRPGETVALVGYTGSGKTTIANLLSRLWDADEGRITLDGIDIRSFPLGDLRRTVQPIQQDVFLFSRSVRENITLGLDIPEAEIIRAARIAQAHDFISALPEGYDTVLQEGAANISTGQRQLISFARIVVHDPPVLIMDEATSSIDTETEKLIKKALDIVLQGRTSLVIAHRLSTIRNAKRILVLAHGTIVEEGTHEELLKQGGLYHALHQLQYEL